jgi:tRNA-dihydrouridine synthase C
MRILLAPMEGLLDHLLRDTLTRAGGPGAAAFDLCVSEFIRVTDALLPKASFLRVVPELQHGSRTPAGVPVRVQLLGSDPACVADNAARAAELGAFGVDLNFGCPANTVNRHRGGAVLLKEPELMRAIVAEVRAALPAHVPVTAKMRLGYDTPEHATTCAQALVAGGAAEIAVHARTKTDGYKPPAYWEWIARIRESVAAPVVANGEIWNVEDARRCLDISGCDALMLGRGAVANPTLALMIRDPDAAPLPWTDIERLLHHYWLVIGQRIQPRHQGGRIKQWLLYLARHYAEAQQQFDTIRRLNLPADIERALFAERAAA